MMLASVTMPYVEVPAFVAGAVGCGIMTHMILDAIKACFELLYDIGRNVL